MSYLLFLPVGSAIRKFCLLRKIEINFQMATSALIGSCPSCAVGIQLATTLHVDFRFIEVHSEWLLRELLSTVSIIFDSKVKKRQVQFFMQQGAALQPEIYLISQKVHKRGAAITAHLNRWLEKNQIE